MSALFICLFFIYGLLVGSFVNTCIYRLPIGESVVSPPSHCTSCNEKIKAYDLIPVISFIILGGRCRNCKAKISVRYMCIELLTGFLFSICYLHFGATLLGVIYCVTFSTLVAAFFIDLEHQIIPDGINLVIALMGIWALFVNKPYWFYILGAFIVSVPILIIAKLTNGFGGGDIKLFAAAGLLLGTKLICTAAFIAIITAGIFGMFLLLFKKVNGKSKMAFGPFIVIGIFISTLWGDELVDWYFSMPVFFAFFENFSRYI